MNQLYQTKKDNCRVKELREWAKTYHIKITYNGYMLQADAPLMLQCEIIFWHWYKT